MSFQLKDFVDDLSRGQYKEGLTTMNMWIRLMLSELVFHWSPEPFNLQYVFCSAFFSMCLNRPDPVPSRDTAAHNTVKHV